MVIISTRKVNQRDERQNGGVAIKSEIVNLLEHPQGFRDRIMQLSFPPPNNRYITFILPARK